MSENVNGIIALPARFDRVKNDLLYDAMNHDYVGLTTGIDGLLLHIVQVEREKSDAEAEQARLHSQLDGLSADYDQQTRALVAERAARRNAEADAAGMRLAIDKVGSWLITHPGREAWSKGEQAGAERLLSLLTQVCKVRGGQTLLAELDGARKVIATLKLWMARQERISALDAALAEYDAAAKGGDE